MANLTTDRNLWVTTRLGEGELALEQMEGHDALGQPFIYDLSLVSRNSEIDLGELLGHPMTVHCKMPTGTTRYFNGIVTRASHIDGDGENARYSVTLQPWLYLLDYRTDCRIFQQTSIPDIIKEVFRGAGFTDFEDTLDSGAYKALEYCVQYRESDYHFVSRLMEQEGIYYFFKHEEDKHTLVLADGHQAHSPQPGYEQVQYKPQRETSRGDKEHLFTWHVALQIRSGAVATTDFDFKAPRASLLSALSRPKKHPHAEGEVFEFPGDFLTRDGSERRAKTRLEERQHEYQLITAAGDVRGLGSGHLFKLVEFHRDDQNKEYLVVSAIYSLHVGEFESGQRSSPDEIRVNLTLLDSQVPYRPPIRSTKNRVDGPQTAIVVGTSGEDIDTDSYGRVKLQFHWDRYGLSDERSSCWVRVAQVWAGAKWGAMHIPRIGQEVIVDFLEGDPDRPIVTGRVYNADNMPPYGLPDNKTQSGIKSRSTLGGGPDNFNEIRFEDKKGSEELFIQAEKDQNTKVKHNQSISVGGDRSVSVSGNETISVTGTRSSTITKKETQTFKDDRQMTVTGTNTDEVTKLHTATYHAGRTETVEAKGDHLTVTGSDKTADVDGKYDITAKTEFQVIQAGINKILVKDEIILDNSKCQVDLKGGAATITAADSITFTCGGASIKLTKDGTVEITGSTSVKVNGGGAGVQLTAAGATMSGTKATVSGAMMTEITGGMVKIN